MPRIPLRYFRAKTVLVLTILLGLMSLPDAAGRWTQLVRPTARAAGNFIVNSTADTSDQLPGDGVCDTGAGVCTLRAAIQESESNGTADTIDFNPGLNGQTISLTTNFGAITQSLTITGPGADLLTVQRSTAVAEEFRIFSVSGGGGNLTISSLRLTNGRATGPGLAGIGGGIRNFGTVVINNCVLVGNSASDSGGGIANLGTTTINSSTVESNTASSSGGGVSNGGESQSSVLNIHNSTISNNTSQGFSGGGIMNIAFATVTNSTVSGNTGVNGGGISNFNPMTLTNVTIAGNSATNEGGGVYNPGIGTVTFGNTLIAGNTAPNSPDIIGFNLNSQDYNLIGITTPEAHFTGTTTHNITNVNALLGPLAANGGSTRTHALLVGSPAIDAGNSAQTNDQRGQPRPIDDQTVVNAAGGNASDIGAYEAHNLEVNSTADTDDTLCRAIGTGNGCTLREAINAANTETGAELITFAPGLTTISLATALPNLTSSMTIAGAGANSLTIQRSAAGGTPRFRIFTVQFTAQPLVVNISGLTISNGHTADGTASDGGEHAGGILNGFSGTLNLSNVVITGNVTGNAGTGGSSLGGYGGGIFNEGTLTLTNSRISGNRTGDGGGSSGVGGAGGGIYSSGALIIANSTISDNMTGTGTLGSGSGGGISSSQSLTVVNSTISGNQTGGTQAGGGGIRASGAVTITNSTISGNQANHYGGGLVSFSSATLTNVTITNNRGGNLGGGGLFDDNGGVVLRNTVVAANFRGSSPSTTADDIRGPVDPTSSFNLIGTGGSGGLTSGVNNNQVDIANPGLGSLANNGGSTQTHALLPDSPAVDAGNNCVLDNSCTPPLTFALTTDQRGAGFNRAADANGDGDVKVDIGAYELQPTVVTNTADSGPGSLRQAIIDANASSPAEAIIFQVGLTGTITLSSALPDIATSMAIHGPGASQLTVQRSTAGGTPNFRIFTINSGCTVAISGLTISNGRTADGTPSPTSGGQGGNGGGILNSGSLTLTNVIVTGNRTGNGGTGGSGTGGFGGFGGGIYSSGTLTMNSVTVSNNITGNGAVGMNGGEGGRGGGIYTPFAPSTLTLTNCTISGNTTGRGADGTGASLIGGSGGYGGGFYLEGGTLTMTNVLVENNTTGSADVNPGHYSDGGSGAGIVINTAGNVTLVNTTVRGNRTGDGPGPSGRGGSSGGILNAGTLKAISSTISGNSTGDGNGGGGSIAGVYNGGTATLINTTISGNSASGTGGRAGGIFSAGSLTLANCTIAFNSAFDNNIGQGLYAFGGYPPPNVRNSIIANNGGAAGTDATGDFNSQGHNLVGKSDGSTGFGVNGDRVGTIAAPLNALLGPLANNGGPTQTHALLAGSPALDGGDNCVFDNSCTPALAAAITTDQRGAGFSRKVDGPDADTTDTVDIGAFEAQVSVADIADQTINEDASLSLPFNVGGAANITGVTATSSNTTLVPNNPANISISGSGSTRTLTINPAANLSGTSTITVTVNGNNSQAMTDTFVLTVNPVNDAPSFMKGADQTVNENDGAQTAINWATLISAGPANESGQAVNFAVTNNSNAGLFAVAPVITPAGTLTYTPATGVSGTAVITIVLMDNGGTANGGVNTSATQSFNISVLEGGALQFSSATFATAEDGGNAVITVTRTGGTAGEARVNYATSNGTATAQDYTATSGTLIFGGGESSKSFNVAITNDVVDEPDETINLTLTGAAGSGSLGVPASAVLTITDNDPAPGISINDVAVTEGNSGTVNATFTVTLSEQSGQTVTVNFATGDGTATAASDYSSNSGTLTFAPTETTKPISLTINGDVSFEPNETFFVNLSMPVNATISDNQGLGTITNDDAQGGFVSFSQASYTVGESAGFTTITVTRSNDLSAAATVDYATAEDSTVVPCATANSIASSRCDFTTAVGTLRFAAGESSQTFLVLISQDNYVEGAETVAITLSNPTGGAALATPSTATLTITDDATEPATNPIDIADAFVRQHYHDFLNREPDAPGLAFWSNQITECQQPGATCSAEVRRINVSAAFFLSIEFQETGYLVYRTYKSAYGNISGTPVPLRLNEFLPDTQQIGKGVQVGVGNWEAQLESNKVAYGLDFVTRARFTSAYPTTLTPAEFVDALFAHGGVTPSAADRDAAIAEFGGAGNTADTAARARALRRVAENETLKQQEFNRAFVLMQYFGYLRRNPNDAPEANLDFGGYNFWLGKLNEFNGNFVNAEMVKAFLVSGEYRQRFGP